MSMKNTNAGKYRKQYTTLRAAHETAGEDGSIIDQLVARVTLIEQEVLQHRRDIAQIRRDIEEQTNPDHR